MIGIYKITSPTGRIYIGQSLCIKRRFYEYSKLKNCKRQPRLYRSLCKHSPEKHIFEILHICKITELNIKERYYQELYSVTGNNGLNCVLQETDVLKKLVCDETRLRLSKANSGKTPSKETLDKRRISMMGKNSGSENGMFGKKIKESSKALQRLKLSGEHNYLSKIILNTQTGIFYFGLREAANSTGMKKATLHVNITKNKTNNTNFIYV